MLESLLDIPLCLWGVTIKMCPQFCLNPLQREGFFLKRPGWVSSFQLASWVHTFAESSLLQVYGQRPEVHHPANQAWLENECWSKARVSDRNPGMLISWGSSSTPEADQFPSLNPGWMLWIPTPMRRSRPRGTCRTWWSGCCRTSRRLRRCQGWRRPWVCRPHSWPQCSPCW